MVNEVLELVEEFVKEHPYACIIAGTGLVVGIITSAVIADGLVDLVVKKGTEEAVKGFIRAIV